MKKFGFSLIELMIVMAIIGVLSTMALYGVNKAQGVSRDTKRIQYLTSISIALEKYYALYHHYPKKSDAIPGGTTYCCAEGFFNGMITALDKNGLMTATSYVDPTYGQMFVTFSGTERYSDPNWNGGGYTTVDTPGCGFNSYWEGKGSVYFAYQQTEPDGQAYQLCLIKESGGRVLLNNP